MMAVRSDLDASSPAPDDDAPGVGHNGGPVDPPDRRGSFGTRPCPECGTDFVARNPGALFCCPAHRKAWNNRWTVRGSQLAQYQAVARLTRDGTRGKPDDRTIGKRCAAAARRLLQRWRDEDRAEGRMDATEFMHRRLRVTDEPL